MKKFLLFSIVVLICVFLAATMSLAGCKEPAAETTAEETAAEETTAEETAAEETTAAEMVYTEAPMLTKLVEEGKLPPLEERLPENPMVIDVANDAPDGTGTYGGTFTTIHTNWVFPNAPGCEAVMMYEPLVKIEEDYSIGNPNIVESYELSEDGLTITFHLRKGLKWSDGVPFTADDIMYPFEHEVTNTELNPAFPDWLTVNGEPITATKVDDYTVQFNFASPYPGIIHFLSHANGCQVTDVWYGIFEPAHYMQQYHPDFMEGGVEEANAKAVEMGYSNWTEMYRNAMHQNIFGSMVYPDSPPTLSAYICVERDAEHVKWQRNPYYFKVDSQGQQLPYIDELVSNFVNADQDLVNSKLISGEAAYFTGYLDSLPLYAENAEAGNYSIYLNDSAQSTGLEFNFTSKDEFLRELFRDIKFRQAVSLAIDRDEWITLTMLDIGVPYPYYAHETSPYFVQESLDKAMEYVKYDPAAARDLLKEIGLVEGADGYFTKPDGTKLEIIFEYIEGVAAGQIELLESYMKDIGINFITRSVTFAQYMEDVVAGDINMTFAQPVDSIEPLFSGHPHCAVPYNYSWIGIWGIEWAHWYTTNGTEGEEPPQEILDLYDWWDDINYAVSAEERVQGGINIWNQMAEKMYKVGLVGDIPIVNIGSNSVKNLPTDDFVVAWNYMRAAGPREPYAFIPGASTDTVPNPIIYEGPPGLGNVAQ